MHRNLDRRVETLVRVDDEANRARLRSILDLATADRTAWRLGSDAKWVRGNGAKRGGPPLQETSRFRRSPSAKSHSASSSSRTSTCERRTTTRQTFVSRVMG
jgi:polyphosphate kinase